MLGDESINRSITGCRHHIMLFVGFFDPLKDLLLSHEFSFKHFDWHPCQRSECGSFEASVHVNVGSKELGKRFLEEWDPPRTVIRHFRIVGPECTILGVKVFSGKAVINDHVFGLADEEELEHILTVLLLALVIEDVLDSGPVLSKRGNSSQEPAVAKCALLDAVGKNAVCAPEVVVVTFWSHLGRPMIPGNIVLVVDLQERGVRIVGPE